MHGVGGLQNAASMHEGAGTRLSHAAHEFEAQMMKELIRPMTRSDDDSEDSGSGGALSDFAGEVLGQSLSGSGGFGIADSILAVLSRIETDKNPVPSRNNLGPG